MRAFYSKCLVIAGLFMVGSGLSLATESAPQHDQQSIEILAQAKKGPHRRPPGKRPNRGQAVQGERVRIQVMVVHATSGPNFMDPSLKRWAKRLRHFSYSSYRLIDRQRVAMVPGGERKLKVLDNVYVQVKLLDKTERGAQLRVRMFRNNQQLVSTRVRVNRNGSIIMAGLNHGDGTLFLPITVAY